ncbi:helix-turn-helix domain-containing protein [Streptomyces sp. NBC_00513]|uniref:helix-turn-helix domain-containing protein n=1 Tax=unclassified Streptomyces TaxID=2593676 RepID=UPI002250D6CF|nr:helix-turn-helix domain-containing protein [Streptomyces sp. NBC_00424]MCX5078689.1 helix-turn-helix domain-containing protein [Streptomyces sp. NBC_00424]WUD39132.1 helix-turn-helix domain-containing protein [Streptomyces sp. NBC_00513]
MNIDGHTNGGADVTDGPEARTDALAELRERLADGLALAGLTRTQLARQAGVSRSTVHAALSPKASLPSSQVLAALARVLRLSVPELLELRRIACLDASAVREEEHVPGKPIAKWDPFDLEVHPAGPCLRPASDTKPTDQLPGYVWRDHDRIVADAVKDAAGGHSRMVMLVGSSSTGKTRACWQGVQPLATEGWRLWHPFDPTRAEAALEGLEHVAPRTVIWLNEAQHYLGDPQVGERIAAAVHGLLTRPGRGPVLVLGTLWPEYVGSYTALPAADKHDPHSRVRELIAGRLVTVPEAFDQKALQSAEVLASAGDRLLREALVRAAGHGRVTQDLAGAPELLRRYEHCTPAARAVLEAAMDARRLGVGLNLPHAFLTDAAIDYLSDRNFDMLTAEDWPDTVFAELGHPVHGKQAPLRRAYGRPQPRPPGRATPVAPAPEAAGPAFRLADYLEQHGRASRRLLCPPASFWAAVHAHLTHPDELNNLAKAAAVRHRLEWSHHLRLRAAEAGSPAALDRLIWIRERHRDFEGADALLRQAVKLGTPTGLLRLLEERERDGDHDGAEKVALRASEAGNLEPLRGLALRRMRAGHLDKAIQLALYASDAGDPEVLLDIAIDLAKKDLSKARHLALRAADAGMPGGLCSLGRARASAGDHESAEALLRRAADAGYFPALTDLVLLREENGDRLGAEQLVQRAVDAGHPEALADLARMREMAGDQASAESLYLRAAGAGHVPALLDLAQMRNRLGDHSGMEDAVRQAADTGNVYALARLALLRESAGDHTEAEKLAQEAATAGNAESLCHLATLRELAGDHEKAEALARRAITAGDPEGLGEIALLRGMAGDAATAQELAREATAAGAWSTLAKLALTLQRAGQTADGIQPLALLALNAGQVRPDLCQQWPHGLDPDGSPTRRWQ